MELAQYLADPEFMAWALTAVIGAMFTALLGILALLAKIAKVLVPFLSQWHTNFQVQIVECDGKFNLIHEKIENVEEDVEGLKTRVAIIETRRQ